MYIYTYIYIFIHIYIHTYKYTHKYEGDLATPSEVSVEECLYLKKSLREKSQRSLSIVSPPDVRYDFEKEEEKEEGAVDMNGDKNYIGEHVFLTSNPYEEDEVDETNIVKYSEQIIQKDSSLMSDIINDRRKLDAIKKHNAFRLRNQQLKIKEKELPLQAPEGLDTEEHSAHKEEDRGNDSSNSSNVANTNDVLIDKNAVNIHVQDSLTNLIGDDKYSNHNDSISNKKNTKDNHSYDPRQHRDLSHHQLQESQPPRDRITHFDSTRNKVDSRKQLEKEQERVSLDDDSDDIYTQKMFEMAHQQV
jgi:hypothetical protein